LTFTVASPAVGLLALIEDLFRDLPTSSSTEDNAQFVLRLNLEDQNLYDLAGPLGALTGASLPKVLTWLVAGVSKAALDMEPERLHLHAAAAAKDGRAAVMAAQRETGKTTTVARLLLRGWDYLSDETVSISGGDKRVWAFAKPLSIKPGGRNLVSEYSNAFLPTGSVPDQAVLHVSVGAVGSNSVESANPHLVVLLQPRIHSVQAEVPDSRPLHPVDAVVGLMTETLDAGRFGPSAALELARFAARCRCHQVFVKQPEATADEIDRLFEDSPVQALDVSEFVPRGRIAPNVTTIQIGERAVVHEHPEGRIMALDETATQVWLALGGWRPAEQFDLNGPMIGPFVEHLVDLGLVNRSPA
jgi:hypothetical protein